MALMLGGIEFQAFELPESIPQGGAQAMAIHKLIGGRRIVDAMGPDDAPIEWSGILIGETAQQRALRLDLLRRTGRRVELGFGMRMYEVVVRNFQAVLERPMLLRYTIVCEIVRDLIAGDGAEEAETREQEIAADLAVFEAELLMRDATLFAISIAAQAVRAALGDKGAQRGTLYVATAAAQQFIGNAVYEATGDAVTADLAMASVQGVAGVIQGGDPVQMAGNMLSTTDAATAAYSAQTAIAAMERTNRNLEDPATT
jgi:hypothetical protein